MYLILQLQNLEFLVLMNNKEVIMKITFSNKIMIKSFSLLFMFCIAFIGCDDDDVELGKASISFGVDSISVSDDVDVEYLQLELTAPLESDCAIYLKSSDEDPIRFSFPEYIVLGEGAVRGKYPIYVKESKFSSPDTHVKFSIAKVGEAAVIDAAKNSVGFTIEGKNSAGKVFIGFEHSTFSVGEDEGYFELPFEIQGVLDNNVQLIVESENGTAIEEIDFEMQKEIQLSKGNAWNFIPITVKDDQASTDDRTFVVRLDKVETLDTLVQIYHEHRKCTVTIRNVERQLQVTDTLVDVPEYIGEFSYYCNLTAKVPGRVTANIVVDTDKSTAVEGVHFILLSKEITVEAQETQAEIGIKILDDPLGNAPRKIVLKLENVEGEGVVVSKDYGVGEILIQNDDNSVGFAEGSVAMAGRVLEVPITIEGLCNEELEVLYKVHDGTAVGGNGNDFVIVSSVVKVLKDKKSTFIEVSAVAVDVDKEFKLELIGLKGESITTKSIIDRNRAFCTVNILSAPKLIDREDWTVVDCISQMAGPEGWPEGKDNGGAINVIDGNDETFWHTNWNTTDPATLEAPHWVVYDMQRNVMPSEIELRRRHNNSGQLKEAKIFISDSSDGPWIEICHLKKDIVDDLTVKGAAKNIIGRYVRIESYNVDNTTLAEFKIFGNLQ